jgi:hypothetical protein
MHEVTEIDITELKHRLSGAFEYGKQENFYKEEMQHGSNLLTAKSKKQKARP